MSRDIDEADRRILRTLQENADQNLDALSETVGLSRNACWRRIKAMEDAGIIDKRVVLVSPDKAGLPLTVFMLIRTSRHDAEWLAKFKRATRLMPEILGAYRMTGDLDYLVRARVADMAGYDALYQRLIGMVEMSDVSASFVMEELKHTTALPV